MELQTTQSGGITIISIKERLDATSAPEAEQQINAYIKDGHKDLIADLSELEYVSSAGLRVFLSAARLAQKNGGSLKLAAPPAQVKQVLDMAGFAAIIPVFASVKQASESFADRNTQERTAPAALSLAEEIYLLALDEQEGKLKNMPPYALDYALAGALLMELGLEGRIDNDLNTLKVVSDEPTNDALLNDILQALQAGTESHPTSYWLKQIADESQSIVERVLASLVKKSILKQEDRKVLWVFPLRRYPMLDDREVKEVRTRLRDLLNSNEIPTPHDIVILSLAKACHLLEDLLTPSEFESLSPRIQALTQLDLIGKEMVEAIRDIERTMASLAMPIM